MMEAMWGGGAGRAAPVWKRRGSHPSGVEEAAAKRCERGRRGVGVEETGPSHSGSVSSTAEGSGPNTGGARIRATRVKQARASGRPRASLGVL